MPSYPRTERLDVRRVDPVDLERDRVVGRDPSEPQRRHPPHALRVDPVDLERHVLLEGPLPKIRFISAIASGVTPWIRSATRSSGSARS
jgi:hypothetical protein